MRNEAGCWFFNRLAYINAIVYALYSSPSNLVIITLNAYACADGARKRSNMIPFAVFLKPM